MSTGGDLGNELLRAAARLTRWASRHASVEIPLAQARLLALVDELGPARIGSLALADHSSQPTMTSAVQRLEVQGLLQRVTDPDDARASLVSLTPAGRSTLERVRAARAQTLAPTLSRLTPSDLARLRGAVEVMQDLLDRAGSSGSSGLPPTPPLPRQEV